MILGHSITDFNWSLDGNLDVGDDVMVWKNYGTDNSYVIIKLIFLKMKASNGGEYTCRAANSFGNSSETTPITVIGMACPHGGVWSSNYSTHFILE